MTVPSQTIPVIIHLRDTVTGFERDFEDNGSIWPGDDGSPSLFMWEEGNYSCDHNRVLFLYDWGKLGGPDPDSDECGDLFNCGSDRIVVDWIKNVETGEIIARDL